jgi:hypothetical protein
MFHFSSLSHPSTGPPSYFLFYAPQVGGHWDNDAEWSALGKTAAFDDTFLLLSKWLWRLGFVRTPDTCSADTVRGGGGSSGPCGELGGGKESRVESTVAVVSL